jgi:replicative DNA helicase
MADSSKLSSIFIVELLQCCLTDKKILSLCKQHLAYSFLENDAQKKIFKFVIDSDNLNEVPPTPGMIAQAFPSDPEVLGFLSQIKKTFVPNENKDSLLKSFEEFIKRSKFVTLFNSVHDLYQEGKQDDAIKLMAQESQKIGDFQLKDEYYTTVFKDYERRTSEREKKAEGSSYLSDKMPWGMRELDEITYGGIKRKTAALILGQSGKGKTTALRWIGIANARVGKRVVHFQIEGSELECLEGYDAAWTGAKLSSFDIQDYGDISDDTRRKIEKARRDILANRGEIYVYAAESFNSMTIEKCRDIIIDIETQHGKVDLAVWDYLEVLETARDFGKGEVAERRRREYIANQMVNICVELNIAGATATQANDIPPKDLFNPDFVMTRHHISEFKGCLKPFSYFLTLNATPDEYRNDIMRIYCDKFRKYKSGQTVTIGQKKDIGRFYDHSRTMKEFYDESTQSSSTK